MPSYGIFQEKDLALNALASTVDRDALLEAQQETVASHNEQINRLIRFFADPVDSPLLAVNAGTANRLQPLDENGRPQPVKGVTQYIVGFPLYKAGTAEGWNFWTNEQMTVLEFSQSLDTMLKGDVTWMRDMMLAPLFYSGAGYTYVNAKPAASYTVFGLANGDTQLYEGSSGMATDSHYSFQAAAISDAANPFPAIEADLLEHPSNAGRLVAFVATGLVDSISLLTSFAPAIRDTIEVVPGSATARADPSVAPELGLPLPRTMKYIGVVGNTFIVSWQSMPANYIVTVAVDADQKPLGWRQYDQPALRGFVRVGEPMSRFPYQQNNYVRASGFAGLNRTAAFVLKIAASYAAPTIYPFPLA
jgi:hypothetical protein